MRFPSITTLSRVFSDPREARRLLTMPYRELRQLPAAQARIRECYHPPEYDVRMHCLNADAGLFGLETIEFNGEYADYLNTGDCYADTLIYWRGTYRVQSVGDFVETMGRRGIRAV